MRLNKRYLRSIKSNIIFYIAASILTMLSVMAFALLYTTGTGIKSYATSFFETQKVEDANFSTFGEITDEEIASIEKQFNIIMEKQEIANIKNTTVKSGVTGKVLSSNNTTVRLFKKNTKINIYSILEGKDAKSNDEIIINKGYAQKHNININDTVVVNNKSLKIVGYFLRPDYMYVLQNQTDSYVNYDNFFLAYTTDATYDVVAKSNDGTTTNSSVYSIRFNDKTNYQENEKALRKYLFEKYITYNYSALAGSARLNIFNTRPRTLISFSFIFLVITPIAVVCLIAIILNIKVKNDQKIIGTITALGYRKKELCMHYSIMSIIPGLLGGILMTIIVYVTQNSFGRLSLQDFEPLPISFNYPWYMAILGIILPTLIYVLASFVTVSKLINKDVTSLLRGAGKESKQSNMFKNLKATTRTKFAFRSIFINKGRSFVVLLGVFASTLILSIAFMMFDTIDAIVDTALAKVGSFEYEYTLSFPELETEDDSNDKINKLLCFIYEYDDKKVPVMGANGDDIDLWTTKLVDGTVINETNLNDNTYYITSLAASLMHVGVGDTVTVKSNFSGDDFTFKVSGIIDNGLLSYILTSKRNVALALSNLFITVINNTLETKIESSDELTDAMAENLYNVILSKEPQQLDSSNIMMIFEKSSIVQQKDAKMAERAPIIYTVLIIGIFVCVIAIFVVVNVIIDDNIGNISMLRVLGYKNNEINWMILSGNHYLVPIGIIVGMPVAYLILSVYFTTTVKNNNMIMPVTMSFKTIALVVGIILACYFGTLLILRKKANRVSMIESLKDNR